MAKAPAPAAAKPAAKKATPAAKKAPARAAKAKAPAKKPAKVVKAAKTVRPVRMVSETTVESIKDQAASFATKAGDKARDYANTGKDKATESLSSLSGFVEDVARSVDERLGSTYGDYARRAASAVSGVADSLKNKEIDDLVADTRKFVREKPAVAIGAAAALGFVLTRLFRSGGNDRDDA